MDPNQIADDTAPAVTEESAPSSETPESQVTDDTEQSAQPESTTEPGTVEPPETTEEPKGAEPSEAEKRIKQLVAKQREAERIAAYWRGVAEGKTKPPDQEQGKVGPNGEELPPVAPNVTAYEDYAEYERARELYIIDLAKFQYRQEARNADLAREAKQAMKSFDEKVSKLAETKPDILEAIQDPTLPISDVEAYLIRKSDVGPEIALYLSEKRDEAQRIFSLHPVLTAQEIGRIEARILGTQKQEPAPTKKISQAPEPVTTVNSRGAPSTSLDDIPIDEFMRRRNKESRQR